MILNFFFTSCFALASERIVSLAPSLTEWLYEFGLGSEIVGNTYQCDYPKESNQVKKIGSFTSPSLEMILAQKPTLVLANRGIAENTTRALVSSGIRVVTFDPRSIDELEADVLILGKILGKDLNARNWIHKFDDRLKILGLKAGALKFENQKKILILLQTKPFYAVSDVTWMGSLFRRAGFRNLLTKQDIVPYPIVSQEFVFASRPDVIFLDQGMNRNQILDLGIAKNIKVLPSDIFVRPGPRIYDALAELIEYQKL